jgi:aminopeptidase
VRTPAGTDLRFEVGQRPFNKQDGDASKARSAGARVRVDREVELPAGVIRVAPVEESVSGTIVIPSARFGAVTATVIRLEIERGQVVRASAATQDPALQTFLRQSSGVTQFREFGLGFNHKLVRPPGAQDLPYYGYGAGVVRLSVGDNEEIGGNVRGGGVRWFFFPDATVSVGDDMLVEDGRMPGTR